jgi:hypothetical protein
MTVRFGTIASILGAFMVAGCSGLRGDDEFERYSQRTDAITMSAGDAKEVNAATHMYSPWPPGVGDRRIVADSAHMQRALERYRRGATPPDPLPPAGLPDTTMGERLQPERGGQGAATDAGGGMPAPSAPPPTPNLGQ